MQIRTLAAAACLVLVGFALGSFTATPSAQQTFLPPDFEVGAVLKLNNQGLRYSVVAQQGAWVRVQLGDQATTQAPSERIWIYAPNGTVWTRVAPPTK
jgi:hypothetical protein